MEDTHLDAAHDGVLLLVMAMAARRLARLGRAAEANGLHERAVVVRVVRRLLLGRLELGLELGLFVGGQQVVCLHDAEQHVPRLLAPRLVEVVVGAGVAQVEGVGVRSAVGMVLPNGIAAEVEATFELKTVDQS